MTIKDLISAMFQLGIDRYEEKHGKVEPRRKEYEKKDLFERHSYRGTRKSSVIHWKMQISTAETKKNTGYINLENCHTKIC